MCIEEEEPGRCDTCAMLMGPELENIPVLTAKWEARGHEIVDYWADYWNIRGEPDLEKRREARDGIVYGMIVHGGYHPVHATSLMKMWQIRNDVDAGEPPVVSHDYPAPDA